MNFIVAAQELQKRAERGIVGMIIKGAVPAANPLIVMSEKDIPKNFSAANAEQIKLALAGYVTTPRRVEVYCLANDAENYTEALDYFEVSKINYLCAPTCQTDGQKDAIVTWVKEMRENKKEVKAVLPEAEADHEGIINYATPSVKIGDVEHTPETFCSRIAGLLAGTPSTISCTFAPIPEATDCTRLKRDQLSAEIDEGRFVVFHDGEKIKVGRGINSLKTIREGQNEQFKKIKIVETMDMINDDLVKLIEEYYIGKYPNSYDNKCIVLCAVMDYFAELMKQGNIDSYSVDIDTQANKEYLIKKGIATAEMSEEELKKADTDDKLFLVATMNIMDAMEDVTINITV